jgi:murein DD-endopeptidase MepM/ murein hydrolase activator NlpD
MLLKQNSIFFLLLIFFGITSCKQITKATDFITKPTAKEIYARDFEDNDLLFSEWNSNFESSKKDSLKIKLPFTENIQLHCQNLQSYSYNLKLYEGEVFNLQVETAIDSIRFFSELFKVSEDSLKTLTTIAKAQTSETNISIPIKETATYKLIVQPEIYSSSKTVISVFTSPTYFFPVAGKDSKAIKSFWGAQRDGGKRSHKGVDIFASRGTPVVASVDGYISSTGNRGLGGNQVWLRDGLFGASLYYAHLDSIATSRGKRVKIGDTLGFVGNTGNAKYTPPHLHFGIYKSYNGAVNPLLFIKSADIPETDLNFDFISEQAVIKKSIANIRIGPSSKFEKVGQLKRNDTISILGNTKGWFHLKTKNGLKAFVYGNLAKPVSE